MIYDIEGKIKNLICNLILRREGLQYVRFWVRDSSNKCNMLTTKRV